MRTPLPFLERLKETFQKFTHLDLDSYKGHMILKDKVLEGGANMVEEWDGEITFSPTNSSKEHLNTEQTAQNNF